MNQTAEVLLRRVEWKVFRRLDALLQGEYRSLMRGFGMDLADLREYQPDDDVRFIDWNVTARLDTPYVRQFLEDRAVSAWFLFDLTGSMHFGSQGRQKLQAACEFFSLMASILNRHGNRFGALFLRDPSDEGHIPAMIPARRGRQQILHVLDVALRSQPPHLRIVTEQEAPKGELTELAKLLDAANRNLKHRSLVFVLSDFVSSPNWPRSLGMLSQRHETLAVHLSDPAETELPQVGLVTLTDAETGRQIRVDLSDPELRARFSKSIELRETQLLENLGRAGVDCLALSSTDDLVEAVVQFCNLRKRLAA